MRSSSFRHDEVADGVYAAGVMPGVDQQLTL